MRNMSRCVTWLSLFALLQALPRQASADPPAPSAPAAPVETESATEPPETSSPEAAGEGYDIDSDMDPSALTDFHPTLDAHGTWEEDPTYGLVWVPDANEVGTDFAPYVTGGHWGLGDGGEWLWVSDYDWGWAPFHYGRWARIGERRWGWIPGRVYAPAWVVWRTGYYDDYYVGWAPMPPAWYWRAGFAVRLGFRPPVPFFFCASQHIFARNLFSHVAAPSRVGAIAVRTQPYVAAHAGVAGGYQSLEATRGPSLAAAHVPVTGMPAQRSFPDARATVFARTAPLSVRSGGGLGLSHAPAVAGRYGALPGKVGASSSPMYRSGYPSTFGASSGYAARPAYRSAPGLGGRAFTSAQGSMSRSFGSAPSPPASMSRSFGSAPAFRGGSSFRSGGSSFHSAPSFRGGGGARHR